MRDGDGEKETETETREKRLVGQTWATVINETGSVPSTTTHNALSERIRVSGRTQGGNLAAGWSEGRLPRITVSRFI